MNIIDAERTPVEDWKHDPKAYRRRCRRIRRAATRKKSRLVLHLAIVTVLLAASVALMLTLR